MADDSANLTTDPILAGVPVREGYKVLGGVVLYQKLGQGGMGAVYRGRHLRLDIEVALKVMALPPGLPREEAEAFTGRFLREARTAAAVKHPNLIRVYDVTSEGGVHFIVMDYVDGESAADRLARRAAGGSPGGGGLPEEEAVEIAFRAARGLAAAHVKGIVHRDVKPDNILIDRDGSVVVADLGLAKAFSGDETGEPSMLTQTQAAMGTPHYMSPEQFSSARAVGPAADVWSLGVTLFQLLTGRLPWTDSNVFSLAKKIEGDPLPSVREACPHVGEGACEIIRKAVRKEPADRYADCGEMAGKLGRHLDAVRSSGESVLVDAEAGSTRKALVSVTPPPSKTLTLIQAAALRPGAEGGERAVKELGQGRPPEPLRAPVVSTAPTLGRALERAKRRPVLLGAALVALLVAVIGVVAYALRGGDGRKAAEAREAWRAASAEARSLASQGDCDAAASAVDAFVASAGTEELKPDVDALRREIESEKADADARRTAAEERRKADEAKRNAREARLAEEREALRNLERRARGMIAAGEFGDALAAMEVFRLTARSAEVRSGLDALIKKAKSGREKARRKAEDEASAKAQAARRRSEEAALRFADEKARLEAELRKAEEAKEAERRKREAAEARRREAEAARRKVEAVARGPVPSVGEEAAGETASKTLTEAEARRVYRDALRTANNQTGAADKLETWRRAQEKLAGTDYGDNIAKKVMPWLTETLREEEGRAAFDEAASRAKKNPRDYDGNIGAAEEALKKAAGSPYEAKIKAIVDSLHGRKLKDALTEAMRQKDLADGIAILENAQDKLDGTKYAQILQKYISDLRDELRDETGRAAYDDAVSRVRKTPRDYDGNIAAAEAALKKAAGSRYEAKVKALLDKQRKQRQKASPAAKGKGPAPRAGGPFAILKMQKAHNAEIWHVEFVPDGSRIVTAAKDNSLRISDAVGLGAMHWLGPQVKSTVEEYVRKVRQGWGKKAPMADRKYWRGTWRSFQEVISVSLAQSGQYLLLASTTHAWRGDTDNTYIEQVNAGRGGALNVWDVASGQLLHSLYVEDGWKATAEGWATASAKSQVRVRRAGFTGCSRRIVAYADSGAAGVYDAQSGAWLRTVRYGKRAVNSVAFSPDGGKVVTGSDDRIARILHAGSWGELMPLKGHAGPVLSAVFSPDGSEVLTASADGTARIWSPVTGLVLRTLKGGGKPRSACYTPDGAKVMTVSGAAIFLWDAKTAKRLHALKHRAEVKTAKLSPDGARLLTMSSDGSASLWDVGRGALLRGFRGEQKGDVAALTFDGTRGATGSRDGTLRLWGERGSR